MATIRITTDPIRIPIRMELIRHTILTGGHGITGMGMAIAGATGRQRGVYCCAARLLSHPYVKKHGFSRRAFGVMGLARSSA